MGTKFYSRRMGANTFDSIAKRLLLRNKTIEIK
jgi:hypothetical protein